MINLTDFPRLARSAGRLAEITRTLAKYGLADALARLDSKFVRRLTRGTGLGRLSADTREARIRLTLTELGRIYYQHCRDVLASADAADEAAERIELRNAG